MPPRKKSTADGLGIPCEHCGSLDTEVIKTQPIAMFVCRQRRCRRCREKTKTVEFSQKPIRSFLAIYTGKT